ncbi:EF-hand domain-containing protein [Noviherbaspirillum pedocola]|uniref:EF-hand domain-containing protein n=1 Tax=Noviherbaspirillum pedocola TaxID=2801341 RepID=A0A934W7F4_9BURK|nr:hypothetical protein [Noviherbaspirillum pedocola]MBK4736315.1 hypothetical protein [Noviherbaspirillum pedocola]
MRKTLTIATIPFLLAACGGGGSDNSTTASTAASSVVLNGQVSDGPIAGAKVCLFSDGTQVRDASGAAICSGNTDAQGNYSMTIPGNLPSGLLTLVASNGASIKLTSTLGASTSVLQSADSTGNVTSTKLPAIRITHFTTADSVLADTNNDGVVSQDEYKAYVANYSQTRQVAAIIKAAIDYNQSATLIGGQTGDTLLLARAAARNGTLGTSNKTAAQWLADPANANIIAAVDSDVATELAGKFANYQLSTVVTGFKIPPAVSANGGSATIHCEINTNNESATVQLVFDAARGIVILRHDGIDVTGSYNAQTGAINLTENDAFAPTMTTPSGITYYSEGYFKLNGTLNASTGNIAGSYSELTANTWSVDSSREECSATGSVTLTKL